jgi:hypothetical protein
MGDEMQKNLLQRAISKAIEALPSIPTLTFNQFQAKAFVDQNKYPPTPYPLFGCRRVP